MISIALAIDSAPVEAGAVAAASSARGARSLSDQEVTDFRRALAQPDPQASREAASTAVGLVPVPPKPGSMSELNALARDRWIDPREDETDELPQDDVESATSAAGAILPVVPFPTAPLPMASGSDAQQGARVSLGRPTALAMPVSSDGPQKQFVRDEPVTWATPIREALLSMPAPQAGAQAVPNRPFAPMPVPAGFGSSNADRGSELAHVKPERAEASQAQALAPALSARPDVPFTAAPFSLEVRADLVIGPSVSPAPVPLPLPLVPEPLTPVPEHRLLGMPNSERAAEPARVKPEQAEAVRVQSVASALSSPPVEPFTVTSSALAAKDAPATVPSVPFAPVAMPLAREPESRAIGMPNSERAAEPARVKPEQAEAVRVQSVASALSSPTLEPFTVTSSALAAKEAPAIGASISLAQLSVPLALVTDPLAPVPDTPAENAPLPQFGDLQARRPLEPQVTTDQRLPELEPKTMPVGPLGIAAGVQSRKQTQGVEGPDPEVQVAPPAWSARPDVPVTVTPSSVAATADPALSSRVDAQAVREVIGQVRRTLAQRDLEALDAGRAVVVSLPQGVLPVERLEIKGDGQGGLALITLVAATASESQLLSSRVDDLSAAVGQDSPGIRIEVRSEVANVSVDAQGSTTLSGGGARQEGQGSQQPSRDDVLQALDQIQRRTSVANPGPWEDAAIEFQRRVAAGE